MGIEIKVLKKDVENLFDSISDRTADDQVELFKDFFLARFSALKHNEAVATLKQLESSFRPVEEGVKDAETTVSGKNMEKLNAIVKTVAGNATFDPDSEDMGELVERLCRSIDTVFESVNDILKAINQISPVLGADMGALTVRQVIRSRLDQTVDPGEVPLKTHLERIKRAFQVSLEAFKEAIQEKLMEVIEEFSPGRLEQDVGSKGIRVGPMYKAALYDAYEQKYKRLYDFMKKGHLLQEVVLLFERKFGTKLLQGDGK